ncbi:hypothetical protein QBC40DRAFT_107058 [Triangularia verruculosa]|uniref:Uncharacterized protein n=1 Tax=Triangularia verruculosa TaxID=2587418 RepID=A0AAN6XAR2_9PEZI|nr:hypothetical protein QBC40DRAFT_107058 [Triangularia verruculosa]
MEQQPIENWARTPSPLAGASTNEAAPMDVEFEPPRPTDDPETTSPRGSEPHPAIRNAMQQNFMDIVATRLHRNPAKGKDTSVLAFIIFPKDHTGTACDGSRWGNVQIRMSYDTLMGLNSSKINSMLRPRAQERFRRRLATEFGMHELPDSVKYVLDFTPPVEGAELADLTAKLWLPRIVKLWFLAGHYSPDPIVANPYDTHSPSRPMADSAVGAIMAMGHDDICKSYSCLTDASLWQVDNGCQGIVPDDDGFVIGHIPPWRKVEDYCPIRHRVSILRVLQAINGKDLMLNSAVRMWTVAQVAIYLEVPQVVVDPVMQWLSAPPNTKFTEICPEKAFELAHALKIPSILTAAFKILVSETAVDYASTVRSPRLPKESWVGRPRDDYGDFPSDPVEYAARAFLERITATFRTLKSDTVFDSFPVRISEWERLMAMRDIVDRSGYPELQDVYSKLTRALVNTFHWAVDRIHLADRSDYGIHGCDGKLVELTEAQRRHYLPSKNHLPLPMAYSKLVRSQQVLTPFFWKAMREKANSYVQEAASVFGAEQVQQTTRKFNRDITEVYDPQARAMLEQMSVTGRGGRSAFDLAKFHNELEYAIRALTDRILKHYDGVLFPFFLSDHLLLNLEDNELKYLPIWADGLDDGSGGVFQEVIPEAEMGPSEPGPGYHTGYTVAGTDTDMGASTVGGYAATVVSKSDLGLGGLELDDATVARSVSVQQTGEGRSEWGGIISRNMRRVVAVPSEMMSEDRFTEEGDGEWDEAMYQRPEGHQAVGQALERYVEEEGGSSVDDVMSLDDDDEEDDGTSTLDGFEDMDDINFSL